MNFAPSFRLAAALIMLVGPGLSTWAQDHADASLKEVSVASRAFSSGDPIPSWVEQIAVPIATAKEPVVLRLASTQFTVDVTSITYVHRALMVNDAGSLSDVGTLSIPFVPDYQRLQLHVVRILRGSDVLDRTASSTVRFLQRETELERGVYSGIVTASILIDDLRVGDTLEYSYSIHGENPVFAGKFSGSTPWDQSYPTLLRHVVLTHSSDKKIAWRVLGENQTSPLLPQESTTGGKHKLRFEESAMAAVVAEPATPPEYFSRRWVQFSEFAEWGDVAAWADSLFHSNKPLDDDQKAVLTSLRGHATNEERVAAALEFVQSEIRYFSVALGESSHRPTEPELVLKRRYGDCKDKSLLLITLLRELGIQSEPVLLQSGRRSGLEKMLPSPDVFDHAIVRATVDGSTFFLDPTRQGQHGRLSRMGQLHEGVQVLVVSPHTREITKISSQNIFELVQDERSETAALPKFGSDGQLRLRLVWNGLAAERARLALERLPHLQIVKSFGDMFEKRYPGTKLAGDPSFFDDRINNVFTVAADYTIPNFATEREGSWIIRYSPDNLRDIVASPPSTQRTAPLRALVSPFSGSYSFEVTLPEEVDVVSDPARTAIEDKHFNFSNYVYFRGREAKVLISLKTLAADVESADLQKYGEKLRSANEAVRGLFLIGKAQLKSSKPAGELQTLEHSFRKRLQDAVARTTGTIDSGKLSESDLASAYCDRSGFYSELEQPAEAIRDANKALQLTPYSGQSYSCRAYAYLNAGEFEKSIADYTKAVTLGAANAGDYKSRAVALFYAKRFQQAADDFLKAGTLDASARLYSDLWLAGTYLRMGKAIPESLLRQIDANAGWPNPVLAMFAGSLSPSDLLSQLDSKQGSDRDMALAEGYFYVGQYYLAKNQPDKARAFFEKTRALGVIIYREHIAAGFELKALGEK